MDISSLAETQRKMAELVSVADRFGRIRLVGGCDVSLKRSRRSADGSAAVVIMTFPSLELVEVATACGRVEFPYIPGLLSFRELPLLKKAFMKLKHRPDLLILDGQGLAHPRRFGIACHAGVELDIATVGCAKSLLCGEFAPLELRRGQRSPILLEGQKVGYALCTRNGVRPVFVSPGHRVSHETAVEIVLKCAPRYRLPEPIRLAHSESRKAVAG